MKVAVAYNNGEIHGHFGHCDMFAVYEYGEYVSDCQKTLVETGERSGHQAMADLMKELGVEAVIVGIGLNVWLEKEQLPEELRRRRAEIIMELQMSAAFDFADRCTGRTLEVLVEGDEGGQYYGRSYMDAPDIDTKVYFTSEDEIEPGSYVPVLITDTDGYDLIGMAKAKEETK